MVCPGRSSSLAVQPNGVVVTWLIVVPASPAAWAVWAQPPTSPSARAVVGGSGGAQPGGMPSPAPQPSAS